MTRPRVSVIVIVLDGERFLPEALESVLVQREPDWELIVVDDGSTDGTASIADEFAARDPDRIRVVRHPGGVNRGMSASRNLGVNESRGAYLTFLDHDDVMLRDRLATHAAVLDAHPEVGAVIGPVLRWRSWEGGADVEQQFAIALDRPVQPPGLLPTYLVETSATPQAFTVRRVIFDRVGGYEASFRGMYEDQVFLAKLSLATPVYLAASVDQQYRLHAESCVGVTFREGRQLIARRHFLRWLRGDLERRDEDPFGLRAIVDAELRRTRWARTRALTRRVGRRLGRLRRQSMLA